MSAENTLDPFGQIGILFSRLIESKRTEKGVRQHALLDFGAYFALPREENIIKLFFRSK